MSLKTTVIIAGIVVGGTTLLVGVDRIKALAGKASNEVRDVIDNAIDDPELLRTQIAQLRDKYPARIAEVRSELADIETQIARTNEDFQISEKVVELASADLRSLDSILNGDFVNVSFDGNSTFNGRLGQDFTESEAREEATRIRQIRTAHMNRADDLSRTASFLVEQRDRVSTLLSKLETEFSEFDASLFQLDQEIDAIDRNDRILSILEKRQKAIDNLENKYASPESIGNVQDRIARIRAEQQARFEAFDRREQVTDYEAEAKAALDDEKFAPAVRFPVDEDNAGDLWDNTSGG